VVEHLLSKCRVLSSNSSTATKKKIVIDFVNVCAIQLAKGVFAKLYFMVPRLTAKHDVWVL
jgi:hypothetical protein